MSARPLSSEGRPAAGGDGCAPPARLLPGRPLPPYAYRPGHNPHPTRDPGGHSHQALAEAPALPAPPDPADWRGSPDYLYGIDLFNQGYYWEAHEAWEGLWVACGRQGPTATYLQALINLAAAGFKARWGSARGLRANAGTAARLFKAFAAQRGAGGPHFMGLEVAALAAFAERMAKTPPGGDAMAGRDGVGRDAALDFDLFLRPA